MTAEEAEKIGKILETADGNCTYCAQDLADKMKVEFPEFDWTDLVGNEGDE